MGITVSSTLLYQIALTLDINDVGVVTQYQPFILNSHVGNGANWGLNRHDGEATILQPYSSIDGEKFFRGTSHAVFQNIDFIDQ